MRRNSNTWEWHRNIKIHSSRDSEQIEPKECQITCSAEPSVAQFSLKKYED